MTKISEIEAGDFLFADSGFNCLRPGEQCEVQIDNGKLFIGCADGRHYLEGQINADTGELVGLSAPDKRTTLEIMRERDGSAEPKWKVEDSTGTSKGYLRLTYEGRRVADFFPYAANTDEAWCREQAALIAETMNRNS